MTTSLNASPRAILRNAASGYLTLAASALIGFFATPVLLHQLGTEGFGVWSLVLGTVAYLALLEAGIGTAAITRIAASEHDRAALGQVLSSTLVLYSALAVIGALVAGALSVVFPVLFSVPAALSSAARVALLLLGLWQSITLVQNVFTAGLLGTGRMSVVNLSGFAVATLVTLCQVAVVLAGGGLQPLAAVQLIGAFVALIVLRSQLRRALPDLLVSYGGFDRNAARRLISLGWRNSVSAVAGILAFGSDIVLVGLLLGARAAAGYAVAFRGYTLLQRLTTGVLGALGPAFAHASAHDDAERQFKVFALGVFSTLALATFSGITVLLLSKPLLRLWLGTVPPHGASVLSLLGLVLIFQAPGMNSASWLISAEKAGELMRLSVSAAALNLGASIIATALLGPVGPAVGSLVAVTVFDAVLMPLHACRSIGRPFALLVKEALSPIVGPAILLAACLAVGRVLVPDGVGVLALLAVAALVYFGTLLRASSALDVRRVLLRREARAV